MTTPDTELTVNHKMIPAFVAYLAEILILFSLLVPIQKNRYGSYSLWEASYGHEKFIYIFSSLFIIWDYLPSFRKRGWRFFRDNYFSWAGINSASLSANRFNTFNRGSI